MIFVSKYYLGLLYFYSVCTWYMVYYGPRPENSLVYYSHQDVKYYT